MMMNRRVFSTTLLAGAAASLISTRGMAANATAEKARNVVLVHGLFAEGSSWSEVIPRLQAAGLNVTSVSKMDRLTRWFPLDTPGQPWWPASSNSGR